MIEAAKNALKMKYTPHCGRSICTIRKSLWPVAQLAFTYIHTAHARIHFEIQLALFFSSSSKYQKNIYRCSSVRVYILYVLRAHARPLVPSFRCALRTPNKFNEFDEEPGMKNILKWRILFPAAHLNKSCKQSIARKYRMWIWPYACQSGACNMMHARVPTWIGSSGSGRMNRTMSIANIMFAFVQAQHRVRRPCRHLSAGHFQTFN